MANYTDTYEHQFKVSGADNAVDAFNKQGNAAGNAANHTSRFSEMLMAAGPQIAAAGDRGQELARQYGDLAKESEKMEMQLSSLSKAQGLSPDAAKQLDEYASKMNEVAAVDDEQARLGLAHALSYGLNDVKALTDLSPLVAAQARDYGKNFSDVYDAIGKAFSSGNVGMLRRFGISLDDTQLAAAQAAAKMGQSSDAATRLAGQHQFAAVMMQAMSKTTSDNNAYLQTAEGRAKQAANAMEEYKESIGTGVNEMERMKTEMTMGMLKAFGLSNKEAGEFAGKALYIGSNLASTGGRVLEFAANLRQLQAMNSIIQGAGGAASAAGSVASMGAMLIPLAVVASALVAAALIYRDVMMVKEGQKAAEESNKNLQSQKAMEEEARKTGAEVTSDKRRHERSYWSFVFGGADTEDRGTFKTRQQVAREKAAQQAGGDVVIPRRTVLTHQEMADRARAH